MANDQEYKECKRQQAEIKRLRKHLQRLSDVVLLTVHNLDEGFRKSKAIPKESSENLARLANYLEHENDLVRYSILGVDFRTDDKQKVVRKIISKMKVK